MRKIILAVGVLSIAACICSTTAPQSRPKGDSAKALKNWTISAGNKCVNSETGETDPSGLMCEPQ